MKADIKSIFYHNYSKRRCNVIYRSSDFFIDSIKVPSVIFAMESKPNEIIVFPLDRFDKEFSHEFTQ
jgi:hypothetical protein